jgi:uncharacterized peroxidase-related enzyme
MSRIALPPSRDLPAAAQPLLDEVNAIFGVVPNLFQTLAVTPGGLEGVLGLLKGLGNGDLDPQSRERIALAIAEINGCNYCASAHTYLARHVAKLDEPEIAANRAGHSNDAKADAAVTFAANVALKRGHVSTAEFDVVRAAGYTDAEIIEIVLHVALNTLTNYVNTTALTEIDFPLVETERRAA